MLYSNPATVTVQITDAAPTSVSLSNNTIKLYDTQVGTLSAEDLDYLETFNYSLAGAAAYPDNTSFAIQGDQLVVALNTSLAPGNYNIDVQVTDGGSGNYSTNNFVDISSQIPAPSAATSHTNYVDTGGATAEMGGEVTVPR